MVGTGRFELPRLGSASHPPAGFIPTQPLRGCSANWGARGRAVLERICRCKLKFQEYFSMVGTGRFELPTPRTPSGLTAYSALYRRLP
jgi:hypothetical protein